MSDLTNALKKGSPLVLDGAVGTELSRRGFSTDRDGWASAATLEAPELLADIHRSYVAAGADLITANTFRTHRRSLPETRFDASEMTQLGVEIARSVKPKFLLGSAGPIADCYEPEATPPTSALIEEHAEHIDFLAEAGVDALLFETMPTAREALVVAQLGRASGLCVMVSLWSRDWRTLGDGESIIDTHARLLDLGVDVVLFNCFSAIDSNAAKLLGSSIPGPWGAYANAGQFSDDTWHRTAAEAPNYYQSVAKEWLDAGASVVGGCCGTTPAHVSALRQLVESLTRPDGTP